MLTCILTTRIMKNYLSIILLLFCYVSNAIATNPSYKDKLEISCRIYGFMKYYHSEVSTCKVNWDEMTRDIITKLKDDISIDSFNNLIINWLLGAGPMQKATNTKPEIDPALSINLKFSWIQSPLLRQDVKNILDTIRVNFRKHPSCWVKNNDYMGSYNGWLVFPNDSITYKGLAVDKLPDENTRIMSVYKYWNIINYFSPNNDIIDIPWDSALTKHLLPIATINSVVSYYFNLKKMSSYLNDVHAEGLTVANYIAPPTYYYSPLLILKYIEGKYTVVKSSEENIHVGFTLNKINNQTVSQMEDSLKKYLSSGNPSVFRRSVSAFILNGYPNSAVDIEFIDNNQTPKTLRLIRKTYIYNQFFRDYYPNDTLKNVAYKKINCEVGYVNMGVLMNDQVSDMYKDLKETKAIIFDIRNYPNGTVFNIVDRILPNQTKCALFKVPDVEYPGTFSWISTSFGINSNPDSYKGKVIILVDQETQSHAEYSAMLLKAFPGAVIVGSQTAGADGNIVYIKSAWDIQLGYTGLGVYWPDTTNTQRVGIGIDVPAYQSRANLLDKRDRVLEIGLKQAGCWMTDIYQPISNQIMVYPNPSTGIFQINYDSREIFNYKVIDSVGRITLESNSLISTKLDLSNQPSGIYTLLIEIEGAIKTIKIQVGSTSL